MTLLASLGTGVVLAYGAHQKQLRQAEHRLHAVQVADRLLATWYSGRELIPRNTSGRVVIQQEAWIWRTAPLHRTVLGRIPIETIRVEIYRERDPKVQRPLASVELIVPLEPVVVEPREPRQ